MVGGRLVMQNQGLVTISPVVADFLLTVDHQRIDGERFQPSSDRESCVSRAYDKYLRINTCICRRTIDFHRFAMMLSTPGSTRSGAFFVAFEFLQARKECPCPPLARVARIVNQANVTSAGRDIGFECERRLGRASARPVLEHFRHGMFCQKTAYRSPGYGFCQFRGNQIGSREGSKVRGQRQMIAPIPIVQKQLSQQRTVRFFKRRAQGAQPFPHRSEFVCCVRDHRTAGLRHCGGAAPPAAGRLNRECGIQVMS